MTDDGTLDGMVRHAVFNDGYSWLKQHVAERFLLFCKLAYAAGALPPAWDWRAFLAVAGPLIAEPMSKQDARERWGGENIFAGALGGRSLRWTADTIFGFNYMLAQHENLVEKEARPEFRPLFEQIFNRLPQLLAAARSAADGADASMFDDVGGVEAWARLLEEMEDPAEALGLIQVCVWRGGVGWRNICIARS
ncbi:hypothetical protein MNEG_5635 [Monoraphidium neglectum]|uniref:Uncharacterized protein n=1 Tax=Monoraphidium neglectum TaxID=145388 RepID=A0A0D2MGX3_9CHLO|nr:hypothetical protein MNEG_5635 [Monoraphidium neglectum]KIZ02325.1 hypothetical protein MNEG_5635 [Monoraphidium neglectum]|eukprot:XP_013901344.1 hypothetical protein MNEG_5635 [Monoraphidium neglectum]